MSDSRGAKGDEKGVDALEHLAYLIAEEFVREAHRRFASHILRDSAIRALGPSEMSSEALVHEPREEFKVLVAGAGARNTDRRGF